MAAASYLMKHAGATALPVLDGQHPNQQIGCITETDIAEATAKDVAKDCGRDQNKPSQLRRFYDELVMLQAKVGSKGERFEQHQPFIQMLKAKVAYAEGRKKVDNNFAALLRRVVDEARDAATLKQARLFREAFMAFYKVHGPKE